MTQVLITGLGLGCVYGLVALGFSLTYRTTGVMNFAQGISVMLGGLGAAWAYNSLDLGLIGAAAVGMLLGTLSGSVLFLIVVRPLWLRGAPEYVVVLATLLFLMVVENVTLNTIGPDPISFPAAIDGTAITINGTNLTYQDVVLVLASVVIAVTLTYFLHHSRSGLLLRSVAENRAVSRMLGVSVTRVSVMAFTVAAAVSAAAGILIAPVQFMSYSVAHSYNIYGFLAAVMAGLSIRASLPCGIAVGIATVAIGAWVSTTYVTVILLALMLVVLVLRSKQLQRLAPRAV